MTPTDYRAELAASISDLSHFWLGNPLEGGGRLDEAHDTYRLAYNLVYGDERREVTAGHAEAFAALVQVANEAYGECTRRVAEAHQAMVDDPEPEMDHPPVDLDDQVHRVAEAAVDAGTILAP